MVKFKALNIHIKGFFLNLSFLIQMAVTNIAFDIKDNSYMHYLDQITCIIVDLATLCFGENSFVCDHQHTPNSYM